MNRIFTGIKAYLSDWKNWLVHSIVGVVLLLFLLFAPLDSYVRLAVLGIVIVFNIFRMKYFD